MSTSFHAPDFGSDAAGKAHGYAELETMLRALLAGETDLIANLSNTAALLYHTLPQLNWAGFYLRAAGSDDLVLGPFQGKPACVRIGMGRGVCGTAAQRRETIVVTNVHEFPGHIACDSASNSEIVVPMIAAGGPRAGEVLGVLDLDSPIFARFDAVDRKGLEAVVSIVLASLA
jgi:GAF domain-containing protein